MKKIIMTGLLVVSASAVWAQENYSTWAHYKPITLNTTAAAGGAGVAGTVTGFPVLVRLGGATHSEIFAQAKTGGADIRFRRPPGPALPYQIESWDSAAGTAAIWVRLDTVSGGNNSQAFNLYWGKPSAADSSRGAAVFDTAGGYQGVWHFANSLSDATRNGYNGFDNATTDAAGIMGRGRAFNGSASISLGNPPRMLSGDADLFTIESWVNWTSIGTGNERYRSIITHGTATAGDQFFMYARNPSSGGEDPYYAVGYYTGSSSNNATMSGIAADAATWVHITGVYDGLEWRVYRNGALGGSIAKDATPVNSAEDWIIGAWGTSRNFVGSMDEIRYSNRVRSSDWIKLSYETQKSGATALTFGATETPAALWDGAGEAFSAAGFSVVAVPAGAVFRLPAGTGRASLSVTDMQGRAVWSRIVELKASEATVVRGDLAAGNYAVHATLREGGAPERTLRRTLSVRP